MADTTLDSTIADILSSVLGRPVAPGEAVTRETEERWDSLKHIEIIFALEAALGVRFTEEDIAAIHSAQDLKSRATLRHAA